MADVAHEQQAAPLQRHRGSVRRGPLPIRLQRAGQGLAALPERRGQVAAHQAQPVAIGLGLVRRIDGGDRILQIDNGGQGRFQHHVRQSRRIASPDRMVAVDDQFDMQAVVDQQDRGRDRRLSPEPDELSRILQRRRQGAIDHRPAGDIGVRTLRQRRRLVQKRLGPRHDPRAARRIVSAPLRQVAQGVGAVQGVIQAAPPRIGGVQQEAGVQHRHHQLRPGHLRDLGVHPVGRDREGLRLLDQIADLAQEVFRRAHIVGLAPPRPVPVVDSGLQGVAPVQQRAVLRGEPFEDRGRPRPEGRRIEPQPRQHLPFDQSDQFARDAQPGAIFMGGHDGGSLRPAPGLGPTCNNA